MYKLDKNAFKRYFFYGDENPEATLEGIIFFSYEDFFIRQSTQAKVEMTGEEKVEELVQYVKTMYKQYNRFITLNDRAKVFNIYKQENHEALEQKIRDRIKKLRETDEIVTEEEIQSKIKKVREERERTYQECQHILDEEVKECWENSTEKIVERTREELEKRRTKQLIVKHNDIYYSITQRFRYAHHLEWAVKNKDRYRELPEYYECNRGAWGTEELTDVSCQEEPVKPDEYNKHVLRHWTEDVYEILKFLDKLEQEDSKEYLDLWFRTRFYRAKNKTIEGIEEKEVRWLEHICERIRKIRLKDEERRKMIGQEDYR